MARRKKVVIDNEKTVSELKAIQRYVKAKGLDVSEADIVLACANLAKRLGSGTWSIYLELKNNMRR